VFTYLLARFVTHFRHPIRSAMCLGLIWALALLGTRLSRHSKSLSTVMLLLMGAQSLTAARTEHQRARLFSTESVDCRRSFRERHRWTAASCSDGYTFVKWAYANPASRTTLAYIADADASIATESN